MPSEYPDTGSVYNGRNVLSDALRMRGTLGTSAQWSNMDGLVRSLTIFILVWDENLIFIMEASLLFPSVITRAPSLVTCLIRTISLLLRSEAEAFGRIISILELNSVLLSSGREICTGRSPILLKVV